MSVLNKNMTIDTIEKLCDGIKKLDTYSKYNQKLDNYCSVNLQLFNDKEISKIMMNLVKYINSKYPQKSYDIFQFVLKKYRVDLKSLGFDKQTYENNKTEATKVILKELYRISKSSNKVIPQTGGQEAMYAIGTTDGVETILENDNLLVASCFIRTMIQDLGESDKPIPIPKMHSADDLKTILNILNKIKEKLKSIGDEQLFYDICKNEKQEDIQTFENMVVEYNFERDVLRDEINVKQDIYKFMFFADYLDIKILMSLLLKVWEEKTKWLSGDELTNYLTISDSKLQELKDVIGTKTRLETTETESGETETIENQTGETETDETEIGETETGETDVTVDSEDYS